MLLAHRWCRPRTRPHSRAGHGERTSASHAIKMRSTPAAKPIDGVGGPPNSSARPSYRPPPPTAFWAESSASAANSNVVRV